MAGDIDTKYATASLDDVLRYFVDAYEFKDGIERFPKGSGLHDPEIFLDPVKRVVIFKFYVRRASEETLLTRGKRRCLYCNEIFDVGSGARRSDSKFCSDQHRIDFNSEKRGKPE